MFMNLTKAQIRKNGKRGEVGNLGTKQDGRLTIRGIKSLKAEDNYPNQITKWQFSESLSPVNPLSTRLEPLANARTFLFFCFPLFCCSDATPLLSPKMAGSKFVFQPITRGCGSFPIKSNGIWLPGVQCKFLLGKPSGLKYQMKFKSFAQLLRN
jgi:hypothetical protein